MNDKRERMSDEDFMTKAKPLIDSNATYREISEVTGLSIYGVRYKLFKLGIRKVKKFISVF